MLIVQKSFDELILAKKILPEQITPLKWVAQTLFDENNVTQPLLRPNPHCQKAFFRN
jgi:hypothetical protein